MAGDVTCADFVGRDKVTITYTNAPANLEKLIQKVLEFLEAGAAFLPDRTGDMVRAELDGETLTFRAGALARLAVSGDERAYLLSLTAHRDYVVWATKFIPLAARVDVKRVVEGLDLPVAYSEFRTPRAGEGGQPTTVPLANITEALGRHTAFIILGEPGAGKTTTLQKVAFEAARSRLTDDSWRVPLFVRLSQQRAACRSSSWKRSGSSAPGAASDGRWPAGGC